MKPATVPLESLRYSQYANRIDCYICGSDNPDDSEFCSECSAPLALAQQARSQKSPPVLLATIGASGVGKTVYLGMLMDMLSRQPESMQMMARGAFSVNLQQTAISALSKSEFPAKTPNEPDRWNWVHCQITSAKHKKPFDLVMPDVAGESLFEEIEHPHTYQVVRSLLEKANGVLMLVDAVHLRDNGLDQDFFSMKMLSFLCELDSNPKTGWPKRPIAIAFTKSDEFEDCFTNPEKSAQQRAPGLWRICNERFKNYKFFATGLAGGCAVRITRDGRQRVPLRIEPRGIVEPFQWLVGQLAVR